MANTISLFDGTTTITLTAGDYMVQRYPIQTPQPAITRGQSDSQDFSLTPWEYSNVAESMELLIQGADTTAIKANARAIQLMLDRVRQRQKTGMGPKIYVQTQLEGEIVTVRSEILSGRLIFSDAHDTIARLKMPATLSFTRRYYWEGPETALTIFSSEDTAGAFTVDVYNNDDAAPAATNYFLVPPASVAGVLPTPAKITITNDAGVNVDWREFFLANWVTENTVVVDPFLLGSEAASGASYALTTIEAAGWRWTPTTLTDTRLTELAGRYYRVLVAFGTGAATTGVYLRAVMETYVSGLAKAVYRGGLVRYDGEGLVDLGALPIPPGGYDLLGSDVSLKITAFRPAGAATMDVDFVSLAPTGDGLYQRIIQIDYAAINGGGIVADGIEGTSYYLDGVRHRPITRLRGLPILLHPDRYNRIRALYREASGFVSGRRFEAQVSYRARLLDI